MTKRERDKETWQNYKKDQKRLKRFFRSRNGSLIKDLAVIDIASSYLGLKHYEAIPDEEFKKIGAEIIRYLIIFFEKDPEVAQSIHQRILPEYPDLTIRPTKSNR